MTKKTDIYCVYCGTKNILEDKKCKKCKKTLDPKNTPIRDYMVEKIKDKVEGDIKDNVFSLIIKFIQNNIYGTILTCSIVFTSAAIIGSSFNGSDNKFELVDERPKVEFQYVYKGKGLSPEEIVLKYGDALNTGNINELKAYELNTFYPDIYEELKGSNLKVNGVVYYTFLDKNDLYDDSAVLFKMEDNYDVGVYFGENPKGKYGEYDFIRYPLYIEYSYVDSSDEKGDGYAFDYSIEFINVDGNYYISGTEVDTFISISQQIHHEFLLKYKGDVSKFNNKDVDKYIDEIDG